MKKSVLPYALPILLISFCFSCSELNTDPLALMAELERDTPVNTLTESEAKLGWVLLSDGQSFDNWHGYNMDHAPDCWIIEDGAFKVLTEGGEESNKGLVSDKSYKNFALSLEFKVDTASNSGIIYQVAEDTSYHYPYETGPEYQVIDDEYWPGGLEDWQTCGANYAMYPPKVNAAKPIGEWNHVLLVVEGNKVTQMLNGKIVVEYEKYSDEWMKLRNSGKWNAFPDWGKYDEGHIALQNHSTVVWYRDIKLKEW